MSEYGDSSSEGTSGSFSKQSNEFSSEELDSTKESGNHGKDESTDETAEKRGDDEE